MTTEHQITPPPELVEQWAQMTAKNDIVLGNWVYIATQAARWGADQELEACCEWAAEQDRGFDDELRTARRPKPPSLKEQALKILDLGHGLADCDRNTLRRALEQLDD